MKRSILAVVFILTASLSASAQVPLFFWVDGELKDASQNPVADTNVTFLVSIAQSSCVLYSESHNQNLSSHPGTFAIKVGDGSAVHSGNGLKQALDVNKSGISCQGGGTGSTGRRTLTVQATLSNAEVITVGPTEIGFSPTAMNVPDYLSAASVNGSTVRGNIFDFFNNTQSAFVTLQAPAALGANYSLTLPSTAGNAGQVLTTDGTGVLSWQTTGGGGSVTSVGTGAGLIGGPITTSGTLSVDVGTTANKIVQLDGTAKLPAVDGSQLVNVNSSMILGQSVTGGAPTLGQVLRYNGSAWTPANDVTSQSQTQNMVLAAPPFGLGCSDFPCTYDF